MFFVSTTDLHDCVVRKVIGGGTVVANVKATTIHKIRLLPEEEAARLLAESFMKQGVSRVSARKLAEKVVRKVKSNRG